MVVSSIGPIDFTDLSISVYFCILFDGKDLWLL